VKLRAEVVKINQDKNPELRTEKKLQGDKQGVSFPSSSLLMLGVYQTLSFLVSRSPQLPEPSLETRVAIECAQYRLDQCPIYIDDQANKHDYDPLDWWRMNEKRFPLVAWQRVRCF